MPPGISCPPANSAGASSTALPPPGVPLAAACARANSSAAGPSAAGSLHSRRSSAAEISATVAAGPASITTSARRPMAGDTTVTASRMTDSVPGQVVAGGELDPPPGPDGPSRGYLSEAASWVSVSPNARAAVSRYWPISVRPAIIFVAPASNSA